MTGRSVERNDVVDWFAAGWREPGSVDRFCDHFLDRMSPGVKLVQPLARTGRGHGVFRAVFTRLFAVIPDLRATVIRSSATADCLFLELDLEGSIGGRPVRWQTTDRLLLDGDGLIDERRSYFDPTPIVIAIATRPWAWPKLLIAITRFGSRPLGTNASRHEQP